MDSGTLASRGGAVNLSKGEFRRGPQGGQRDEEVIGSVLVPLPAPTLAWHGDFHLGVTDRKLPLPRKPKRVGSEARIGSQEPCHPAGTETPQSMVSRDARLGGMGVAPEMSGLTTHTYGLLWADPQVCYRTMDLSASLGLASAAGMCQSGDARPFWTGLASTPTAPPRPTLPPQIPKLEGNFECFCNTS